MGQASLLVEHTRALELGSGERTVEGKRTKVPRIFAKRQMAVDK